MRFATPNKEETFNFVSYSVDKCIAFWVVHGNRVSDCVHLNQIYPLLVVPHLGEFFRCLTV